MNKTTQKSQKGMLLGIWAAQSTCPPTKNCNTRVAGCVLGFLKWKPLPPILSNKLIYRLGFLVGGGQDLARYMEGGARTWNARIGARYGTNLPKSPRACLLLPLALAVR
jgi:hypothetical protein